jgi:hypothetical protein
MTLWPDLALMCVFMFSKKNGFEFWRAGGGEVPPPAHRLLWFEKVAWAQFENQKLP